jgi:hypothetical protein
VTGVDLDEDESSTPAWHERTPTVVGASIAALLALLLLYLAVSCVAQEANTPDQGPQYFLDPGASTSRSSTSTATTTTQTITSTSPPVTKDINPNDTPTSTSDSSSSTSRHRPTFGGDDTTSRRRPTFNQTRPGLPPFTP